MDRRETPDIEPMGTDEPAINSGQRFAKLIRSPASRKVALPRLLVAGVVASCFLALVGMGVTMLFQSVGRWVERRPEHQLRFDRIELVPPPDPWIKGGAELILEQVRTGAKLGETISLLDLELKGLEQDFRGSPWVKDVLRVDRSNYRRLIVSLVYRKPVAILEYGPTKYPYVLDEEAVVLNDKDIDWASWKDPYRPIGMGSPLLKIMRDREKSRDFPEWLVTPRVGLSIKRKGEVNSLEFPDPLIQGAARLARFLLDHGQVSRPGKPRIEFDQIYLPEGLDHSFFLRDSRKQWVSWGPAPGDEKPPRPSAEAKWSMLGELLQANGPLGLKPDEFIDFTHKEAIIRLRSSRSN